MPLKDWLFTAFAVAAVSAIAGWAVWMEYRGYCISDYTCTANVTPRR